MPGFWINEMFRKTKASGWLQTYIGFLLSMASNAEVIAANANTAIDNTLDQKKNGVSVVHIERNMAPSILKALLMKATAVVTQTFNTRTIKEATSIIHQQAPASNLSHVWLSDPQGDE